jgi:hypothetical protein
MMNLRFTIYDLRLTPQVFWSAVAERSGDTAFQLGQSFQSGVARRFPPQSKRIWLRFQPRQVFRV